MKYSNEIKVGAAVIISVVIFILGVRYFEDIPLFRGTHALYSEFDNAGGLISGNVVRVTGVSVGSVDRVYIHPETGRVRVEFHVDRDIPVTVGSYTHAAGFDAIGAVRLELILGPTDAELIPEGGEVESRTVPDMLGSLGKRAPELVDRFDQVLMRMDTVLAVAGTQLGQPGSDFRKTLSSVQSSVATLESILLEERQRIGGILMNVESMTGSLDSLVQESGQDLPETISNLNGTLATLDHTLGELEGTSTRLNTLLDRLNDGEGTLGRLINDPGMYNRMDSTLTGLNDLLEDFKANPGKYLKEMRIIDLF